MRFLLRCVSMLDEGNDLKCRFESPTTDAEIGTPNLNPEKTRFGRNRNLKNPGPQAG
jgi:hypothetical protein